MGSGTSVVLQEGHWAPKCQSSIICSHCPRKHNSLVHQEAPATFTVKENVPGFEKSAQSTSSSFDSHLDSHSVLLGTALVQIRDFGGTLHTVRAQVDSVSQISAITLSCLLRLGLHMSRWTAPVTGLSGASVPDVQGIVECQIQPRFSDEPVFLVKAWVFPLITA